MNTAPQANPTAVPMPAGAPSLEQLRDLQLPAEVSFWPPAPGWWLLAALLLGGLVWGGLFLWRRWQRNAYRRAALALLSTYQQQLQQDNNPQRYLTQVAQLLRRTALHAYPQQRLAGLTDNAWRQFLIDSSGLDAFNGSTGDALLRGPYQAASEFDTAAVTQLARDWIRQHKRRWPC